MRKTMNGHVRIMMDTDRPMLKSHMAPTLHTLRDGGRTCAGAGESQSPATFMPVKPVNKSTDRLRFFEQAFKQLLKSRNCFLGRRLRILRIGDALRGLAAGAVDQPRRRLRIEVGNDHSLC